MSDLELTAQSMMVGRETSIQNKTKQSFSEVEVYRQYLKQFFNCTKVILALILYIKK